MLELLNTQSPAAAMLWFAGGAALLNSVGYLFARPLLGWFRATEAEGWNGTIGSVLSCFGVFYGLLLGLLAVAAYQGHETAESRVAGEASALVGIYADIRNYPQPVQAELHAVLKEYARVTVEEDWGLQQQGKIPVAGSVRMRAFTQKLYGFQPADRGQEILHASVVQQANTLRDMRRHRLYSATAGLPPVLWYVVIVGAALNAVLLWLLDIPARSLLLLGGIVSVFLGTVVGVIALMDNPFRGPIGVDAQPFRVVLELVMKPQTPKPG